ncbi:hypothetical protein D1AOALGA4SA_9061 [Olavius algarvensis Delta 1 endosymbiont]|nr:hypothetical protein D1AOALGA4SA_9061 [Olavius algarvensis Delta 1 endosymbiont]
MEWRMMNDECFGMSNDDCRMSNDGMLSFYFLVLFVKN